MDADGAELLVPVDGRRGQVKRQVALLLGDFGDALPLEPTRRGRHVNR